MTEPRRAESCLNCGQPAPGEFCSSCGQRNTHYRVSLFALLGEALGELLQVDSKLARTFVPFLVRPGFLTREYNAGRRTHYTSPLRLYVLLSVLYFVAASLNLELTGPTVERADASAKASVRIEAMSDAEVKALGTIGTRIQRKVNELAKLDEGELGLRVQRGLLSQLPKMMVLLVPLFALLLKILYVRSGRFYIEHLILALHVHAFAFLVGLVLLRFDGGLATTAKTLLVAIYLFASMHIVYRQRLWKTTAKFAALSGAYFAAIVIGGTLATAAGVLLG